LKHAEIERMRINELSRAMPIAIAIAIGTGIAAANAQASGVVISQVYGGGGNSGAPLHNDFIELFNAGQRAGSRRLVGAIRIVRRRHLE
jgi:hypothetical protein